VNGWQLLGSKKGPASIGEVSDARASRYVRFVVVSCQSAFIEYFRKAAFHSADEQMAANEVLILLPEWLECCGKKR
jgi:hypothetical protein